MNVAGAIYLTGGWVIYVLDTPRSWVCLLLFGVALWTFIADYFITRDEARR